MKPLTKYSSSSSAIKNKNMSENIILTLTGCKRSFHFWENVVCTEKMKQICSPRMHNGCWEALFIDAQTSFCKMLFTHVEAAEEIEDEGFV